MKTKLDIVARFKKFAASAYKMRGLILTIVVIGLIGYMGYLISKMVALPADQAYLTDQRAKLDQTSIKFDKNTIQVINNLQQVNPTVDLSNVGKSDPFSP